MVSKRQISLLLRLNLPVLERTKVYFRSNVIFSNYDNQVSKMNCISRRDDKSKNLFVEKSDRKSRWNLYSQIAIENDLLICAKEAHNLTDICIAVPGVIEQQTCTLMDTNEVVYIGLEIYPKYIMQQFCNVNA